MSVYRETNADVVFEHPIAGPLTANVYREGVTDPILTVADISPASGKYTLSLTWRETVNDGNLRVVWSDAVDFVREQQVEVVTPLLSMTQLRDVFLKDGQTAPTDAELRELEQTVRVFIQAYTGQSFGYSLATKSVETKYGKAVLGTRAAKLTTVTGGDGVTLRASADGYTLYVVPSAVVVPGSLEELEARIDGYAHVIYAPGANPGNVTDATFTVTGAWGYESVPEQVQEAAMLLANDFSCNETVYRDRYLESIKIQQDTLTYHPGAFRGTGNARADLLLGRYRRSGMVII